MSKVWFSSDQHFGHANIIKYCNRPFADVDDMRRVLTEKWNEKVGPRDRVYVLGDFAFGNLSFYERILKSLNGEKYLIRGNHDRGNTGKLEGVGFRCVLSELLYQLGPHLVIMSHYPYAADPMEERINQRSDGETFVDKFAGRRPKDKGNYLLHGHVHTAWKKKGRCINVGVDRWGYAPVSEGELVELIKSGGTEADASGPKYEE